MTEQKQIYELRKFRIGMYDFNHKIIPYLDTLNGEKKEDDISVRYDFDNGQVVFAEFANDESIKMDVNVRCSKDIIKKLNNLGLTKRID